MEGNTAVDIQRENQSKPEVPNRVFGSQHSTEPKSPLQARANTRIHPIPENCCSPVLWDQALQAPLNRAQKRSKEVRRKVTSLKKTMQRQGVDVPLTHYKGCTYLLGSKKLVLSISGNQLLVRTGGGWTSLVELLERLTLEDHKKLCADGAAAHVA